MSAKGKINFLQLARYSERSESGFRYFFELNFDFLRINTNAILSKIKSPLAIAFDPSYISKSGKKTPGIGYFWSGCANKAKLGLEFCGLAALDLKLKTAYYICGFQTINVPEKMTLLEFYASKILENANELLKLSNILTVDAYFSKEPFVSVIVDAGFHIVSRFRNDAHLRYVFKGKQSEGRGPKRKYDGKVCYTSIKESHLPLVSDTPDERIYSGELYSNSLRSIIKAVVVFTKNKSNTWSHKTYFSTNLKHEWKEIIDIYRLRFQIEFLYRDAKQHTGLNDCEARSAKKLNFHLNMALTAVSIAKMAIWLPKKDSSENIQIPFSMQDIKCQFFNKLFVSKIISMFGIDPELEINSKNISKLLDFGKKSA